MPAKRPKNKTPSPFTKSEPIVAHFYRLSRQDEDLLDRGGHIYALVPRKHFIFDMYFIDDVFTPVAVLRTFKGGTSIFDPKNYRPVKAS